MAKSKNFIELRPKAGAETQHKKKIQQRRQQALDLRMAGASYMDIVKAKIGYNSVSHVSTDINDILAEFTYETPEDVLVLDLARLDELQKYLTFAFRKGDYGQANTIMRVMQFRRETLGITPEVIAQRRTEAQNAHANGIMVIQGTPGDYLEQMMQASGASPEEMSLHREAVSSAVSEEAPQKSTQVTDTGRSEHAFGEQRRNTKKQVRIGVAREGDSAPQVTDTSENDDTKKRKVRKIKLKPAAPGPGEGEQHDRAQNRSDRNTQAGKSPEVPQKKDNSAEDLTDRFIQFAQEKEAWDRAMEQQRAVQPVDPQGAFLSVDVVSEGSGDVSRNAQGNKKRKVRIRIKNPDANQAPGPGVVYRRAPKKPIPPEEVLYSEVELHTRVTQIEDE